MELDVTPVVDEAAVWGEVEARVSGALDVASVAPWRIENVGQAGWAMSKLHELHTRAAEYDDELARWKQAVARINAAAAFFEDRLTEWGVRLRRESDTTKSFPLSRGTVSTRKGSAPRIVVVNEPAAVEWASTACPEAVKVTRSFLVSQLSGVSIVEGADGKVVVDADGLVVPGLAVEEPQVTATVKVDPPELPRAFTAQQLGR